MGPPRRGWGKVYNYACAGKAEIRKEQTGPEISGSHAAKTSGEKLAGYKRTKERGHQQRRSIGRVVREEGASLDGVWVAH